MNEIRKIKLLKQFNIFKDLNDYEIKPIIDYLNIEHYPQQSILFLQNEPIPRVFFLISGQVKVFRTNFDGKEQIINILQKKDMLRHQGLFRHSQYTASVEVLDDDEFMTMY